MLKRIYAVFRARNLEFLRDRGTLGWNILLPFVLMIGLAFIFGGASRPQYTVGVLQQAAEIDRTVHPFLETRYIRFVPMHDPDEAMRKVARHQLDLLVRFEAPAQYWVNPGSPKGYFVELALRESDPGGRIAEARIEGDAVRYVDWVLPGILGMNMMFSCLFGVGYVVVRYRKSGFLKRLHATPLSALEFLGAQVLSRLAIIVTVTVFLYLAIGAIIGFRAAGSPALLLLVAVLGALAMIALGLTVAARFSSEELIAGLLNLISWPMMLLSGVWFSLEGSPGWVRAVAQIFPLTHVLDAARAVMFDGAGLADIGSSVAILAVTAAAFLLLGAWSFRWRER